LLSVLARAFSTSIFSMLHWRERVRMRNRFDRFHEILDDKEQLAQAIARHGDSHRADSSTDLENASPEIANPARKRGWHTGKTGEISVARNPEIPRNRRTPSWRSTPFTQVHITRLRTSEEMLINAGTCSTMDIRIGNHIDRRPTVERRMMLSVEKSFMARLPGRYQNWQVPPCKCAIAQHNHVLCYTTNCVGNGTTGPLHPSRLVLSGRTTPAHPPPDQLHLANRPGMVFRTC
jgi:hypothetical protein